ncbi:tryptophan synthase alpha subunit [Secundilactobacillus oryzae JCM 18671]|uniref:Tryptophan synthase alpha chain n=1 Tax=Secundilactobacillus oryzae JCM 18671 TaxID=1291743 RepID=A0A081BGD3_9LACO|nr:tryptophan synthase subunit alpha [Secundilactobacillus oryzae]GAK47101.1 tryptophan synthase alpha subunit [Secundilactobacillus oryzae JCM 18671]
MTKLNEAFKNHKALIPFVVAGDPDFEGTVSNVIALAEAGADVVELGIPFSDPVADGPVIQAGYLRAFDQGVTVERIFQMVTAIREQTQVPLVFLTYINIPFKYGYEAFCERFEQLNISGLVIPDLPYESRDELAPIAEKHGIALVPLITLTSGARIPMIAKAATGFIYMVSSMGVTGTRDSFTKALGETVTEIRRYTDVPIAIGFGIHTPEQAHELSQISDGVIVGSAMVDIVGKDGQNAPKELLLYTKALLTAIDQPVEV